MLEQLMGLLDPHAGELHGDVLRLCSLHRGQRRGVDGARVGALRRQDGDGGQGAVAVGQFDGLPAVRGAAVPDAPLIMSTVTLPDGAANGAGRVSVNGTAHRAFRCSAFVSTATVFVRRGRRRGPR